MSGTHYLPIMALAAVLAAPFGAFAQEPITGDTFNERYPAEQPAPQPSPKPAEATTQRNITAATGVASGKRKRTRVVVQRRSFLDAGTDVVPGDRKFLDYALPPTHTPIDVVQNTGGRVGWHNSPLPGPFFPWW